MFGANYLRIKYKEMTRDFTCFGNPFIAIILILFVAGITRTTLELIIGLILIELIGNGIKLTFFKDRPKKKGFTNFLEKMDAGSFPSIHTARATFALGACATLVNFPVSVVMVLLIPIVAITRILLRKHDLTDVMGGFILGSVLLSLWIFYI